MSGKLKFRVRIRDHGGSWRFYWRPLLKRQWLWPFKTTNECLIVTRKHEFEIVKLTLSTVEWNLEKGYQGFVKLPGYILLCWLVYKWFRVETEINLDIKTVLCVLKRKFQKVNHFIKFPLVKTYKFILRVHPYNLSRPKLGSETVKDVRIRNNNQLTKLWV